MNEYLIVSDTHGADNSLISLVYDHPHAKALIFLGDGMSDLACVKLFRPSLTFYAVKGNCDWCGDLYHGIYCPAEQVITLEGHKIFLSHGHMLGVKSSTDYLLRHALSEGAEAAFFGHTHIPLDIYDRASEDGPLCHLFNPGSLGRPDRGGPSFGILQIDPRPGLVLSHGHL